MPTKQRLKSAHVFRGIILLYGYEVELNEGEFLKYTKRILEISHAMEK